MSQCTNETTINTRLTCIQHDYNMNNQFVGLRQKLWFHCAQIKQLKQPFFQWKQECFDIKDNLYNQFFIITSTDSWTFHTFHPSIHESVATQCEQNKGSVIRSLFYRKEVKAIRFCLSLVFFNTWNAKNFHQMRRILQKY